MFGRAGGQPENDFQVTEGRFGGVSTIYDPKDVLVDERIATNHNAYGYIAATNNYQVLRRALSVLCCSFMRVSRGILVVQAKAPGFLLFFLVFSTPETAVRC